MDLPALRYDVNCSMLFPELPLLERPAAARAAGFAAVEFWWPFASPVPSDAEAEAFVRAVRDAGVALVSLNGTAGSPDERGLASVAGREREFRDNLDAAVGLAAALECPALHVLYGNRIEQSRPQEQDELAAEHLALAAGAAARIGAVVLVEALSGAPRYPLRTARDVLAVLDRVGRADVRFLCDVYHLSVNGDDPAAVLSQHLDRIGHVQIADAPGRSQPGTGALDVPGLLHALDASGYRGCVGLEYAPTGSSEQALAWLPSRLRAGPPASAPPSRAG